MRLNNYDVKPESAKVRNAAVGGYAVWMEGIPESVDEDDGDPTNPGDVLLGWYELDEMAQAVATIANRGLNTTIDGIEISARRLIDMRKQELAKVA